ncbi:LysR family transcriptional regulator [Dyella sp.]|uniref:LysR family transcriptional regulator n=1 Tax=Dyella sp. TaxID=1869338 RepID=UPI002ED2A831
MDRLHAMRVFTRIVQLRSFTRAADDMNLPRATLTHAIKRLESELGTQLLQRTTRRIHVTRDGETYYTHCQRLLADLDEVEGSFRDDAQGPRGRLRIDLPISLARTLVVPALPSFFARYPQIDLDVSSGDRFVNLVQEGVDCVLRIGELANSELVGRRVGVLPRITVASAGYLRKHGVPENLTDLQNGHLAVNWASPTTRRAESLEFIVNRKLRAVDLPGRITVSSTDAYVAACMAGLGIAQMSRYRIEPYLAKGQLREILSAWSPPSLPVTVLYPRQQQLPARLRVFVDWLVALMEAEPLGLR